MKETLTFFSFIFSVFSSFSHFLALLAICFDANYIQQIGDIDYDALGLTEIDDSPSD